MAYRRRLIGAVDAIDGVAEVESAGAQRIAFAAGHEARQIGLPLDHFFRRMPVRPLAHVTDTFGTGPSEPVASDADTVTQRLAAAEYQIEERVRRIDHDRAGRLRGGVIDELPVQLLRQFGRTGCGLIFRRQSGDDGRAVWRSDRRRRWVDTAGDVGRAANFAWRPRNVGGSRLLGGLIGISIITAPRGRRVGWRSRLRIARRGSKARGG